VEKRSVRSVIRSQKQVIRAQNVLIDWLLEQASRSGADEEVRQFPDEKGGRSW
jgi:hypothetical protein